MKISNSKQQLAKIISENGGWRDGAEWAAMDKTDGNCNDNAVGFFSGELRPECFGKIKMWRCRHIETVFMGYEKSIFAKKIIGNWHQTVLSRAECLHLYPAPDAKPEFCESAMRAIPEPTAKPTIEQLAADYRSAKDYSERKQQEADDAKADADEKLRVLEIAGEALGLLVTPITAKQDPEMVIAVQVGDEVECIKSNVNPGKYMGRIGTVSSVDVDDTSTPYLVDFGGEAKIWCHEVKFIRRP